jgi:hypothetical protein
MARKRWPEGAEENRRAAIAAIREARRLQNEARRLAKTDPQLQTLYLADASALLADAERYLLLARLGEEEDE